MMIYAESSAVLSWLLEEHSGGEIGTLLAGAQTVLASELTLVECERALVRFTATGAITTAAASRRRSRLRRAVGHWTTLGIGEDVLAMASRPLPAEPIRTLDALHVATVAVAAQRVPELHVLSLDRRVRESCLGLGLEVLPSRAETD
jgi:predicted nucleic acid-binding protein